MIMNGRKALLGMLLGAALLVPGCDHPGSDPQPLLTMAGTWHEQGNDQHTFQFADDADFIVRSSGAFEGTETLPGGTPQYQLDGSWNDGTVTFTVQRAQAVTYSAEFTGNSPQTLVFSSSAGALTLVRN
jgi:hypothetical protein